MALNNIPDEHHVARVCPRNRAIRHGNQVVGVHPALYKLREATALRARETYLSTQYLEFYNGNRKTRLRRCVADCMFPIRANDYMVVLNAGKIRSIGKRYQLNIRVVHDTRSRNPSYSHIINTPRDETHAVLVALAELSKGSIFSVADIESDDGVISD